MIISVNIKENKEIELADEWTESNFRDLELQETHIEEFLRKNISLICGDDESMLVIGQQVENVERGRSDLTAIDGDGNLVLIEIKRDKKDIESRSEPMEIQAIRYAASYASIKSIDEIVEKIYAPYIHKYKREFQIGERTEQEFAKRNITSFLSENNSLNTFNTKQRIVLVASEFDKQTLSAVSWLISNDVDISCIEITPLKYQNQCHLNIERILPVSTLSDFYVDVAQKNIRSNLTNTKGLEKGKKTHLPRMDKLMKWGLISKDDTVYIKNHPNEKAKVLDQNYVEYKNDKMRFNQWAQLVTGWSSICIYEWLYVNNDLELLHDKRLKYMQLHPEEN